MKLWHKILLLLLIIILIISGIYLFANISESEVIGSNDIGYITKSTYSHYGDTDNEIAIVTGMHPREKLSSSVLPSVLKVYALFNNVKIVNYHVTVSSNAEDFTISRNNGETLVNEFVVNDISKENFDFVIIGHDHEEGYGDGFYIATPSMDSKSISLAENVMKSLTDFNYYKRDITVEAKSSSIKKVDDPIVATGTPLFVYEIPEWLGFIEAFINSYKLIGTSFNNLN
jgi:hypothetical protein